MLTLQRLAEKVFVILSLLFFTGALAPYISESNPLYPLKQALPNICLLVTFLLITARLKRVASIVIREQLLWILMGMALASAFWSDEPMVTLEKVMPVLRVTVFGVYFATRYTISEQLRLLAGTFGIAVVLCLLFGFVLKSYGVVGAGYVANMEDLVHSGAWRGIYIHKTVLGSMMSISALVFLFCALDNRRYNWVMWTGVGLSIYILLRSTTKAALLVLLLVLVLLPLYRTLRWNYTVLLPFLITILLVGGSVAIIFVSNADTVLSAFGKDVTLTGRTDFWPLLLNKSWQRPWLGYGYLTFWYGGWEGQPADIWRQLKWGFEPPHAHNGFLEVLMSFGLVGLALFLLSFLTGYLRSIRWLRLVKTAEGLVPLIYLTLTLLFNLTESFLMRDDILWLLYVSATLSMYYEAQEGKISFYE
jgi:O-antigen ligase